MRLHPFNHDGPVRAVEIYADCQYRDIGEWRWVAGCDGLHARDAFFEVNGLRRKQREGRCADVNDRT
jgi:hypothetical protein